jgi:hypothetical protein
MELLAAKFMNTPRTQRTWEISAPIKAQDDQPAANVQACAKVLAAGGRLKKATSKLQSQKVFDVSTAEHRQTLKDLLVDREIDLEVPDDLYTNPKYHFKVNPVTMVEVLMGKDKTTGRGLSNWGFGDLQALCSDPKAEVIQHLATFLEAYVNGGFEPRGEFMRAMRSLLGLALQKKNPDEARGVGIREVFANLASAVQVREEMGSVVHKLSAFDLGISAQDGVLEEGIALQTRINMARTSGEDLVVIKLDIVKAYDNTRRASILRLLIKQSPSLVRHFLAIYGPASSLHYIGMQEVFEVKEGLITGDSLSPLFATMVYSDCCKKTRELFLNTDVFAYFDDITPVSRGEEAWAAFDCMKESLAEEGLQLHPSKMEAYFNDLTDYHRGEAAKRGVSCTEEGLEILGCPVGSEEFIRAFLRVKVARVLELLDRITKVDSLGRQVPKWASPQALYHVLRDCVVHMLRHLIRSVDPAITKEEFGEVDAQTLHVASRVLGITQQEMQEHVVSTRLSLPMRHQGLGLTELVASADTAYVGAIHSVAKRLQAKIPSLNPADFSGFLQAVERLQLRLNNEEKAIVPSARDIIEGAHVEVVANPDTQEEDGKGTGGKRKKKSDKALGWRMQNADFALKREELSEGKDAKENHEDKDMTGQLQFALQNVTCTTSADFLTASTCNPQNRVFAKHWYVAVRTYLGLPVTAEVCKVGDCMNRRLYRNGDCSGHVRGEINNRHTEVKKKTYKALGLFSKAGGYSLEASMEVPMSRHFEKRKNFVDSGKECVADFMTEDDANHFMVFDVVVVHPKAEIAAHWSPDAALNEAVRDKHVKYCEWEVDEEDVIPIALTTYKGMADETFAYFKNMAFVLAAGDTEKSAKIFRRLREVIAIALVWGQGRVIDEFNRKNSLMG